MSQKVPPLEETKAIILKAKGPAWLKEAETKFDKQYGNSVKHPDTRMWLIGKQAGLSVAEIKPVSSGGEGTETTIVEIQQLVKKSKTKNLKEEQGWTRFNSNGGSLEIEKPDNQAKYGIRVCLLSIEEGETRSKKPKYDMVVTDGTGCTKMVANGDAVSKLAEVNAAPGTMLNLPLVNVQYGTHNFSQEKDKVWWKFSLPPFGDVKPLEASLQDFFPDLDVDVPKEDMPGYFTGFITHMESKEQEVCLGCTRWVLENKPDDHDRCKKEGKFETEMQNLLTGSGTSNNGQTYKLAFAIKPKVKVAEDMVEVYGKVGKQSIIDVAFVRKVGSTTNVATAAPAVVTAKPKPKAKAAPPPVEEPEAEEQAEEAEEAQPTPAPKPKVVAKPIPAKARLPAKPAPPPAPEPDEDGAVTEEQTEDGPEEAQEPEEPPVVVKAATKTPTAAKTPAAPAKAPAKAKAAPVPVEEPAEDVEIPEGLDDWLVTHLPQFGGKQRIFVLTRNALGAEKLTSTGDFEQDKAFMTKVCVKMIADGRLEWTSPLQNEVRVVV